jgi:iron-sulfur cluster assembly accessory protein
MLQVSSLAIDKLKEVLEQQGGTGHSLRVVAMPADTGGLQYMLTVEKEIQPDDMVLKMDGLDFLVDSDSAPFLEEASIDYVEQLGGRVGFVINNPMFASGCGCGGHGCGCGASHEHEHAHGGGGCGCGAGGACGCGGH